MSQPEARALSSSTDRCSSLTSLSFSDTKVTATESFAGGTYTAPDGKSYPGLPAFCRAVATSTPSADSRIGIEVWLPTSTWNGRYEGTGIGGYAGRLQYRHLASGVHSGFASAQSDLGCVGCSTFNGDANIGHPERWKDFGWRGTHEMTVAAKEIIKAYYSRAASYSYFAGCSTGGQQALMEAQRFPDDYDGILAGDAANFRTHLHQGFVWTYGATMRDAAALIPAAKVPMITRAVLARCGGRDGAVATDGFLTSPECHWNPAELLCAGADAPDCLTAAQVKAAQEIYRGPPTYPGAQRGSENDALFSWDGLAPLFGPGVPAPVFDSLFKWVFGANWDWRTFDFDRDSKRVDQVLAADLNAMSDDLDAFRSRGHKLIQYHGVADPLIPPQDALDYHARVSSRQRNADEFYRLFLVPGLGHCFLGPGPDVFGAPYQAAPPSADAQHDIVAALTQWVESGTAPEKIITTKYVNDVPPAVAMQRPICVYPKLPRYKGSGDTNSASSFECGRDDDER